MILQKKRTIVFLFLFLVVSMSQQHEIESIITSTQLALKKLIAISYFGLQRDSNQEDFLIP